MIVISLLVALSFSQAPAADQAGRISGRVTLAGASTPIAGARVILIPAQRPTGPMAMPPQTITDQDGRYEFDGVRRAATAWTCRRPASRRCSRSARAPARRPLPSSRSERASASTASIASCRRARSSPARSSIRAASRWPTRMIMVMRHVEHAGAGAACRRRMMPAGGLGQQTNDLGEFRVSGLAPGEYYVAAMPRPAMLDGRHRPEPPPVSDGAGRRSRARSIPGTTDEAAAQPLAVAAGAEVGNINFAMQTVAAFRVSGIVVDESGNPVANAMVMLTGDPAAGSMGPVGNARTADDGRFVMNDVPPGTYRANADRHDDERIRAEASEASACRSRPPASRRTGSQPIVVTDADVSGCSGGGAASESPVIRRTRRWSVT